MQLLPDACLVPVPQPSQQVMPEPNPSSFGRCSHGMPVCSTYRIPRVTSRSGNGLRPGYRSAAYAAAAAVRDGPTAHPTRSTVTSSRQAERFAPASDAAPGAIQLIVPVVVAGSSHRIVLAVFSATGWEFGVYFSTMMRGIYCQGVICASGEVNALCVDYRITSSWLSPLNPRYATFCEKRAARGGACCTTLAGTMRRNRENGNGGGEQGAGVDPPSVA